MKTLPPRTKRVAIIGAGVVGTALGYLLKKAGYEIAGIASRTLKSARKARGFIKEGDASTDLGSVARKADIVFITTSDDAIENACISIASEDGFRHGAVVFHTCGALPSSVLKSARKKGAKTASLHPLQSLANVKEAVKNLPGSYFCIEGDRQAVTVAKGIVKTLKGKEITIQVNKKPLYHAGACAASNFLVATVGFGLDLFQAAGINKQDSLDALMPLIKGTVKNIETLGIPAALTGPIARGDTHVIEDHLHALSKKRKKMIELYSELGKYTVKIARQKGTLKKDTAQTLIRLFNTYQKGLTV
jgi:predicted short-subunit dehydrogenase-like oxidoreductase (DUF2520 family)